MNNYKIIIDASHGGDDVGCLLSNVPEKNITLELSKYMYQKFQQKNIPTFLIRDKDETIFPKERIKRITEYYGDHKYVIVISNHIQEQPNYQIIYRIGQSSKLPNRVASYLMHHQELVQCGVKRLGINPNLNYYAIQRDVANMQVICVYYPFSQSRGDLDKGVDMIVDAVYEYITGKISDDSYQIVAGDTMWNVAKKFQMSVNELKKINGFTDNLLRTGEIIQVKKSDEELRYFVGTGENLYQICNKFHIELEELMKYNHKKNNLVQIGEEILIPKNEEIYHQVQKGDNIYQIAKKYQVNIDELMQKNDLKDHDLKTGDIIVI